MGDVVGRTDVPRKIGLKGVTFTLDDGTAIQVTGVKFIRQWLMRGERGPYAHCVIVTLDIEAAKSLARGSVGRLTARFRGIYSGEDDPEPTDLGRWRVSAPTLYCGGHREVASAKIRLDEEPAAAAANSRETTVRMVEGCPADKTPEEGSYRHFFFDDRGRPQSG